MKLLDPRRDSLWRLVVSPVIWALHFLLSYAIAAVWCAKVAGRDGSLEPARIAILVLTLGALIVIGRIGAAGWAAHRSGGRPPHDEDTPQGRHRLLGLATALLSWLSAVAVVYTALAAAFIRTCE